MPTWDEILKEVEDQNPARTLEKYVAALSHATKRTTICYLSAFTVLKPPVPPPFHSIIDQDIQGFMSCSKGVSKEELDLVLHTPGGDYEATKRIINYLQEIYAHIRVFVPHMAMSGGTLMACAADEILMGPYSSLVPTDPQIWLKDRFVPIDAVINEFERAFKEVADEPAKALLWNERLSQIPFGIVSAIETMKTNAKLFLKDLLKKRNCKNRSASEVGSVVDFLSAHEKHSSHGKGICLKDAQDNYLNVSDLRSDKILEDHVLSIYHAAIILFQKTPAQKIIINNLNNIYANNFIQQK